MNDPHAGGDAFWREFEARPKLECLHWGGFELRAGDQVRLAPRDGADILDLVLKGEIATIESIEQDYDNKVHLAVVINDDPGRDLGMLRQPGHRFFFTPDEVEPLGERKMPAAAPDAVPGAD